MWINRKTYDATIEALNIRAHADQMMRDTARGENTRLAIENARLRSDLDWFKLRLNQVEKERGQLIQAALGVKVAVPEFVPTYENPINALSEMPNFATVGQDAVDDDPDHQLGKELGVDYSLMPGYQKSK